MAKQGIPWESPKNNEKKKLKGRMVVNRHTFLLALVCAASMCIEYAEYHDKNLEGNNLEILYLPYFHIMG